MQKRIAKTLQLLVVICMTTPALSQNILKGKVIDSSENKKLHNSIVALIDLSDTTLYRSWRAGADGGFSISKIPAGKYTLLISYPRMADFLQDLNISDTSNIDLGNISMITEAKLMQEVVVTAGRAIRMRGDTLEYTADSFAVKPGANVQALLKRLPGIEVSRTGAITAQGQEVKKLLVDGDEFFTDDPKFAAQYLRANAVDKVQVFDKKSDMATLTGFDDGKKTKTINIKMKNSAKNGYFGKVSTGANGDGNYEHELMVGAFKGPLKAGVFGIASKSMSRDFSSEVLSRAGGESMDYIEDGVGMMVANKSQSESIGQYNGSGLPSILNGGAHFSNKWGNNNKYELMGNYRLRTHTGDGWGNSTRFTKSTDTLSFLDKDSRSDKSEGFGHNLSGQVSVKLDTFTRMMVKMAGSKGRKEIDRNSATSSANFRNIVVNSSASEENEITDDQSLKSSVTILRDMPKIAGKLNVTFEQEYSDTRSNNRALTENAFFDGVTGEQTRAQSLDRLQASIENYEGYGGRASLTNRFNDKWFTQFEYGLKVRMSESRFNTMNGSNGKYDDRVDSLSNNFDFTSLTQIAGAGINYNTKKWLIGVGSKVFLTGLKQFNLDAGETKKRTFTNLAPYFRASYNFSLTTSLNINYSGATVQPSMEQLQPLRRTANQLVVQEGNPDLVPGFNNNLSLSFNKYNLKKELMLMVSVSGSLNTNVITNATTISEQGRVSRYVNVDGLPGVNAMVNLSKGWRSKGINIGGGFNYSNNGNYNIQNGELFRMYNSNFGINSNIRYDFKEIFNLSFNSNFGFSRGRSELKGAVNSNNFNHSHNFAGSVSLPWKLEIGTDLMGSFNPGNGSFASSVNVVTWNANIQKKFLQSEGLVLKASVNDILNKATGYQRSIDGANWSESNGFVLRRYFMVSLSWNFLGKL
ncbi:outer membrane beta-barrel protein [Pseudobacter ginsenosidimutans]|nr:outer membrane beta-barrel protein [Pseudobacter ginsenosidimutans]QEC43414.1 outer membrane beta-barrel protein [Pseudobacter ginsenosidimutans]